MKDTGGLAFPRAYSVDDSCDYYESIPDSLLECLRLYEFIRNTEKILMYRSL